jgi:hypothetical protein
MESLVDVVTTSFQAVAAVAVVFTCGYAINTKQDVKFASVSSISALLSKSLMVSEHPGRGSKHAVASAALHYPGDNNNDLANPSHA